VTLEWRGASRDKFAFLVFVLNYKWSEYDESWTEQLRQNKGPHQGTSQYEPTLEDELWSSNVSGDDPDGFANWLDHATYDDQLRFVAALERDPDTLPPNWDRFKGRRFPEQAAESD